MSAERRAAAAPMRRRGARCLRREWGASRHTTALSQQQLLPGCCAEVCPSAAGAARLSWDQVCLSFVSGVTVDLNLTASARVRVSCK